MRMVAILPANHGVSTQTYYCLCGSVFSSARAVPFIAVCTRFIFNFIYLFCCCICSITQNENEMIKLWQIEYMGWSMQIRMSDNIWIVNVLLCLSKYITWSLMLYEFARMHRNFWLYLWKIRFVMICIEFLVCVGKKCGERHSNMLFPIEISCLYDECLHD